MTCGENIKRMREEHSLSQSEVAEKIGVAASAVCGWERGNKRPSLENLCCLADLFLCSTDELLGRKVI